MAMPPFQFLVKFKAMFSLEHYFLYFFYIYFLEKVFLKVLYRIRIIQKSIIHMNLECIPLSICCCNIHRFKKLGKRKFQERRDGKRVTNNLSYSAIVS